MKTIRFALIGCGRIAKNHVGPLTELPRAKLAALCDLVAERSKAFGQKIGVPTYTNYHEMLRKEEIDVVNILTPSGMHIHHAVDVIRRYRKHVVIEKPLALSWKDLKKLEATANESGVKVFPIFQNRYNKAVQKVRHDVLSGRFGKLVLGTIRVRWCRPQSYYDRDPWRGTWAMDGGALANQGIHSLDLLQYIMGDVDSVFVRTATQLVKVEVEDTAAGVLTFRNGALGIVEVTTAARPDDMEASISILTEKGAAVLGGIASNVLDTYTLDPSQKDVYSENFSDAYGRGHWPFFEDVIADLLDGIPHPISFAEGTRAIPLLNALYRSAEDQTIVHLSDNLCSRRLGQHDPKLFKLYETLPRDT